MVLGRFFVCFYITLFFFFSRSAEGHVVEQFYASYEAGDASVLVNFDVAYAMPDVRDVPEAPQPTRSWLVGRSDGEHRGLRLEAERYLRSYISFESDGEALAYSIRFPDFDSRPYAFPKLLNAGAYYNVELVPEVSDVGLVSVHLSDGRFPRLVLAYGEGGEYDFNELQPGGGLVINGLASGGGMVMGAEDVERFSIWQLLVLGFSHVIPDGLDHVFFIIGMCLMAVGMRQLLWQSLVFTLAHSVSMALVVSEVLAVYSYSISGYIEAIIALSIAFIAVESLFMKTSFRWRCLMIGVFGFVHGLGFAGVLGSKLQFLSADGWVYPLVMANIGIEIAQAVLVVICFGLLFLLGGSKRVEMERYFRVVVAMGIAGVGIVWFISRLP